jgi:S1-C subfamily serine protease
MRLAALLLALTFWACSGCYTYTPAVVPLPPSTNTAEYYRWLADGTYQVQTECLEGSWSGTGVVLSQDGDRTFFATAHHVVNGTECAYLVNNEPFELMAFDEKFDSAVLMGHLPGREVFETPAVFLGQDVIVVGWPRQPYTGKTAKQITKGNVSSYVPFRYKVSAPAYFGNSGGPAFDTMGNLVGLVVQIAILDEDGTPFPGEVFATPAWRVYELLEDARSSLQP